VLEQEAPEQKAPEQKESSDHRTRQKAGID